MTNEEMIERYKAGDYQILDQLIAENERLIKFIANRYYIKCSFIDIEDLTQEGWTGFLKAVEKYNPEYEKRAKFSTYAIYWIKQAIGRFLQQKTPQGEVSLDKPISDDTDLTLGDTLDDPDAEDIAFEKANRADLHQQLSLVMDECLSLQQREIVKLRVGWDSGEPWTLEAIGELFDIQRQGVMYNFDKAMWRIRRSKWGREYIRDSQIKKCTHFFWRETDAAAVYHEKLIRKNNYIVGV